MTDNSNRTLRHIYLPAHGEREKFTSRNRGGEGKALPQRDRASHAAKLRTDMAIALATAQLTMNERDPNIAAGREGFYLEFKIPAAHIAIVDKLESGRGEQPIELLSVQQPDTKKPSQDVIATVFVPAMHKDFYDKKIKNYETKDYITYEKEPDGKRKKDERGNDIEKSRKPKNQKFVNSVNGVRHGDILSLFNDPGEFPAPGQEIWWEVWLRKDSNESFLHVAHGLGIEVWKDTVQFVEREVMLIRCTGEALNKLIANSDAVAELRLNRDTPAAFMDMKFTEQIEWTDDVLDRFVPPPSDAPAVCILDSGATRVHPMIKPALAESDHHASKRNWTPFDDSYQWSGHGTQMSGLALFGDLTPVLLGSGPIAPNHRLESVKILPDRGQNDPSLYGHITASAVSIAEIQAPERARTFCMAVTENDNDLRGRPSSWSAKVDDIAYGEGTDQRLIAISAGNINETYPAAEYLDQNDLNGIESPGQAWNALTVGAITNRCTITDPSFAGWQPMAPVGDLSPSSRTSVTFDEGWPIKPEVVFEGGNHAVNPITGAGTPIDDLVLLSTFHQPNERLFIATDGTSAATALVARMSTQLMADNRQAWPETIRGLIVHSARWTKEMRGHLPPNPTQKVKMRLLRRYGYGVPDLDRALRSTTNDVTLVVEKQMQPFRLDGRAVKMQDMILHDFPWPRADLEALGDTPVIMRVTLSYFIEPNPGDRGWQQKHKYASHGLRFAVKRAEESKEIFRRRINKAARDEGETTKSNSKDPNWFLGPNLQNKGSIHSDAWKGTAADLASRHAIAVYPIGGWWKQKPKLKQAEREIRYSLIVSLEAPIEVDLYTPISTKVSSSIEIEIG